MKKLPEFLEPDNLVQPYVTDNYKNNNFSLFSNIHNNKKTYVPISGCLIEHLITNIKLSSTEKLYYLLTDSLAIIAKNSGKQRAFALPGKNWANLLACSKAKIFSMQTSLQQKQYFIIHKSKNNCAQNNRNLITPTLPDDVFQILSQTPNRYDLNGETTFINNSESKLSYLDRTKLFIPLNYQLLVSITNNQNISSLQKLIWLDFYFMSYKKYRSTTRQYLNQNTGSAHYHNFLLSNFTLSITYQELMERYSLTKHSLSKILNDLETKNFIKKNRNFIKVKNEHHARLDKSLWQITTLIPESLNIKNTNIDISSSDSAETIVNNNDNSLLQLEFDFINISQQKNEANSLLRLSNKVANTDPHIAKSGLLLNKDLKIKIKDTKSNLEEETKVLFDNFLEKNEITNSNYLQAKQYLEKNDSNKYKTKKSDFNICSELIRANIKILPKDKAEKARKFAYFLTSKGLACGYAASLSKHELAKQLIHHAATWKPTKLGSISREKEIDTALAVAWKAIVKGTWQMPLDLAKAQILQYEFNSYKQKYHEFGIMSYELSILEVSVRKLLGSTYINLEKEIRKSESAQTFAVLPTKNGNKISDKIENDYHLNALDLDYLEKSSNNYDNGNGAGGGLAILNLPSYFGEQEYHLGYGCHIDGYIEDNREVVTNIMDDIPVTMAKTLYVVSPNDNEYQFDELHSSVTVAKDSYQVSDNSVIDLSNISEKQKYLRMIASDKDGEMIIKAVNDGEYLFKLQSMQSNSEGDVIMTLRHADLNNFISDMSFMVMKP